jgi:hypothetical protein
MLCFAMRAASDEEVEAKIEKKHWPQMNADNWDAPLG